ncbi:hypothetical protein [Pseudarthrobacter sp. C4D7]|uniref:hypothetical protein n=1 Tax=Pseudarthrobacter sp. C4D7 TaxID=2735268 RepID=UPI001584C174|nr:hypothetical protein [Pseudarthrobacter sp. C4D7]NUT70154.1 hypothetical protein [Pseudarthrobacter sp. C4D7]
MPATLARSVAPLVAASLLAALAACSPAMDSPAAGLDLANAKQSLLSQQDELKAVVRPDEVTTWTRTEKSRALFECGNGGYYWPGTMEVVLTPDADAPSLLPQIEAEWSAKPGWTVQSGTGINGIPELVVVSGDGYRHSIEYNPQRNSLYVLSSSACFHMEGRPDPGVDY